MLRLQKQKVRVLPRFSAGVAHANKSVGYGRLNFRDYTKNPLSLVVHFFHVK